MLAVAGEQAPLVTECHGLLGIETEAERPEHHFTVPRHLPLPKLLPLHAHPRTQRLVLADMRMPIHSFEGLEPLQFFEPALCKMEGSFLGHQLAHQLVLRTQTAVFLVLRPLLVLDVLVIVQRGLVRAVFVAHGTSALAEPSDSGNERQLGKIWGAIVRAVILVPRGVGQKRSLLMVEDASELQHVILRFGRKPTRFVLIFTFRIHPPVLSLHVHAAHVRLRPYAQHSGRVLRDGHVHAVEWRREARRSGNCDATAAGTTISVAAALFTAAAVHRARPQPRAPAYGLQAIAAGPVRSVTAPLSGFLSDALQQECTRLVTLGVRARALVFLVRGRAVAHQHFHFRACDPRQGPRHKPLPRTATAPSSSDGRWPRLRRTVPNSRQRR